MVDNRVFLGVGGFSSLAAVVLLTGCASETLFRSNFDPTPIGQPPAHTQAVGTAAVDGPPGSVVVVAPPVLPSGKWVQISRPERLGALAAMQGNFAQFRGAGTYTFSATLFIPSGSGVATVQFESFGQNPSNYSGFLHLDFLPDGRIRIDDRPDTAFGEFPHDQPFVVQVTLRINPSSPTARIVLAGAGASGQADYTLPPPARFAAQQFGAVRIWMGSPFTGKFDATNIAVTRARN